MRRVRALRKMVHPSRLWVFVCETGQDPTPAEWAQVRPGDKVLIEEIPVGYFGIPWVKIQPSTIGHGRP